MRRPYLVVMLKAPRPGRVKTRLAQDIGTIDACWWFRRQTRALLRRVEDPRWQVVLAVTPEQALWGRDWPAHLPKISQGTGDLGARMTHVFRVMPPGPVCIIGGDIPGLQKRHVAQAFGLLGQYEAVLGPALDGGYWLIGLHRSRAVPKRLLDGVRWSSEHALTDTRAALAPLSIGLGARLSDVDRATDL